MKSCRRDFVAAKGEEKGSSRGSEGENSAGGQEVEGRKKKRKRKWRSVLEIVSYSRSPESRKGILCRMQQRPRREALLGKEAFLSSSPPPPKKREEKRNSSRQKSAPAFPSFLPLIVQQERKIKIPPTKKEKIPAFIQRKKLLGRRRRGREGKKRRRGRMKPKTPSFLSSPRRPFHRRRAAAPKFFSPPSSNFFFL